MHTGGQARWVNGVSKKGCSREAQHLRGKHSFGLSVQHFSSIGCWKCVCIDLAGTTGISCQCPAVQTQAGTFSFTSLCSLLIFSPRPSLPPFLFLSPMNINSHFIFLPDDYFVALKNPELGISETAYFNLI